MEQEKKVIQYQCCDGCQHLKVLFEDLKRNLLLELAQMLRKASIPLEKKWMKSVEVMKLLEISHGKLQTMRNARKISFTRLGGSIYYDREDIEQMFEENKTKRKYGTQY